MSIVGHAVLVASAVVDQCPHYRRYLSTEHHRVINDAWIQQLDIICQHPQQQQQQQRQQPAGDRDVATAEYVKRCRQTIPPALRISLANGVPHAFGFRRILWQIDRRCIGLRAGGERDGKDRPSDDYCTARWDDVTARSAAGRQIMAKCTHKRAVGPSLIVVTFDPHGRGGLAVTVIGGSLSSGQQ